ncbi:MAG: hypothetical protein RLZZ528_1954 [Pseudomonadota bacterium]
MTDADRQTASPPTPDLIWAEARLKQDGQAGTSPTGNDLSRARARDDLDLLRAEIAFMNEARSAPHLGALDAALNPPQGAAGPQETSAYTIGLALSGGGIRSGIVSLGVLQRLAKARILEQVDYLSTVSGGGFIGTSLSWWMHNSALLADHPNRTNFDLGANLPWTTHAPDEAEGNGSGARLLAHLRRNGRYLMPGNGHGIAAGLAVVLRSVMLNLFVWIPLVAAVCLVLYWLGTLPILNGIPAAVGTLAPGVMDALNRQLDPQVPATFPPVYLLLLTILPAVAAFFAIVSANLSVQSWTEHGESNQADENAIAAAPSMAGTILTSRALRWIGSALICLVIAAMLGFFLTTGWSFVEPLFANADLSALPEASLSAAALVYFLVSAVAGLAAFGLLRKFSDLGDWSPRKTRPYYMASVGFLGFIVLEANGAALLRAIAGDGHAVRHLMAWLLGFGHIVAATCFFFLTFYLLGLLIRVMLHDDSANLRYAARRHFERFFGIAITIAIVTAAVGVLPLVAARISPYLAGGPSAVLSLLAGVGSAVWGHYRTYLSGTSTRRVTLVLSLGSLLLLYGILISGYLIAQTYVAAGREGGLGAPDQSVRAAILCVIVVAAIVGWFTNLNYLSLHRFYRDRLAEAFMPERATTDVFENRPARHADELKVCGKQKEGADKSKVNLSATKGPYHLINANVILDRSRDEKYRSRGGDSFILSPLYCGSAATGWQRSCDFARGELTLASAMAISGAAANPRSGFAGTGATRNGIVSLAMSVLSLRLGYWVVNPLRHDTMRRRANHFDPSAGYALPGVGYTEQSRFLELSDGGHFENLGLYELVRRRCGLIIICDGGQDPDSSYSALTYAALRIKEDFGAILKFNVGVGGNGPAPSATKPTSPGDLVPRASETEYPRGAEYARRGFFLATVKYAESDVPGPDQAIVIYLKSALIPELGLAAKAYRGSHPDFPYQSTSDQFFDAEQFEAYREVGYRITDQMLRATGYSHLFSQKGQSRRPDPDELRRSSMVRVLRSRG